MMIKLYLYSVKKYNNNKIMSASASPTRSYIFRKKYNNERVGFADALVYIP